MFGNDQNERLKQRVKDLEKANDSLAADLREVNTRLRTLLLGSLPFKVGALVEADISNHSERSELVRGIVNDIRWGSYDQIIIQVVCTNGQYAAVSVERIKVIKRLP